MKEQYAEMEEMKAEMNAREKRLSQGEYAIDWVNEMVEAGQIAIDDDGRPNIIRNEASLDSNQ